MQFTRKQIPVTIGKNISVTLPPEIIISTRIGKKGKGKTRSELNTIWERSTIVMGEVFFDTTKNTALLSLHVHCKKYPKNTFDPVIVAHFPIPQKILDSEISFKVKLGDSPQEILHKLCSQMKKLFMKKRMHLSIELNMERTDYRITLFIEENIIFWNDNVPIDNLWNILTAKPISDDFIEFGEGDPDPDLEDRYPILINLL